MRETVRQLLISLSFRMSVALLLCLSLTLSGCFLTNDVESYYGRVTVPTAQEFRWSDGGLPQTFDPALAAAPPDTDAVRAMFEGLTDYDPLTLAPVPGVAARWEASEDKREWTFHLRRDAVWSNGDPVTARDFVRSWQRTLELGSRAPHGRLLDNIVGVAPVALNSATTEGVGASGVSAPVENQKGESAKDAKKGTKVEPTAEKFGAEAVNDYVLRVRLEQADAKFPELVAHPIFRPVHEVRMGEGNTTLLAQPIVSNGPFRLTQVASDGVILERASNYWDAQTINLSRVRFVATRNAEDALGKYRAGEVDAVTNAGFEPLALKLLSPYKDFRRATFGALTYYKFNARNAPFNDPRVREALAIGIDRERISEDEMDGASEPAKTFLPTQNTGAANSSGENTQSLSLDVARAKSLLAAAGYPDGAGFPRVRLLVNRNDQQRQIAQSVANMWRTSLGIETDVILKNWDEYEAAVLAGDYDVVRKGMVMQTTDEAANMRALFESETATETVEDIALLPGNAASQTTNETKDKPVDKNAAVNPLNSVPLSQPILSEAQALKELPAIPIYFASSYAMVKPYVSGFESNLLDAPSLKRVRIDSSWQAPKQKSAVWFKVGN